MVILKSYFVILQTFLTYVLTDDTKKGYYILTNIEMIYFRKTVQTSYVQFNLSIELSCLPVWCLWSSKTFCNLERGFDNCFEALLFLFFIKWFFFLHFLLLAILSNGNKNYTLLNVGSLQHSRCILKIKYHYCLTFDINNKDNMKL